LYSYREAEKNLETWNGHHRRVNNHMHVKRMTDKVGAVLSEHNQRAPTATECPAPAQDLIIQVDAGLSRVIASNFTIGIKSIGYHIWSIPDLSSNRLINLTL